MATDAASPRPSALLAFRAENVRSFKHEFELSLLATTIAEEGVSRAIEWREDGHTVDVLPVVALFGANASGKSNVLRAMHDMRSFVLNSFRHGRPTGGLPQRPFRLHPDWDKRPSSFEVDFILDGVRHQYGFALDRHRVLDEWAVRFPRGRSVLLFSRDGDELVFGTPERTRSRAVKELLRPNALFLSTAASANHPIHLPIYRWFERNLLLAEAASRETRQALTAQMLDDPEVSDQVLAFLREADLGIVGAVKRELDPAVRERIERAMEILFEGVEDIEELPSLDAPLAAHLVHRGAAADVQFDVEDESLGTLVWFGVVGPVIHTLRNGSVLLADELDASLHPVLVAHLIALFQNPDTNPNRAQLIFDSHDATILGESAAGRLESSDRRLLGRDQIWFTEKINDGATRLYPLSDLAPRKDESIQRRYLAGRYGATPIISRDRLKTAIQRVVGDGVETR